MSELEQLLIQYKKDSAPTTGKESISVLQEKGKRLLRTHIRILELIGQSVTSISGLSGYTHIQTIAAPQWVIEHNLDKFPQITTIEAGTGEEVEGSVKHLNNNIIQVTFSKAISGVAYLN